MIDSLIIQSAKKHIELSSRAKDADFFCSSRDVFQARLDSFIQKSKKYLESALIGEVGNNTFDHNWVYSEGEMRGAYFNLNFMDKYVVLADYGRGIKESLSSVIKLSTDVEAVETGFTKQISGRTPEQRGNGLKFVAETSVDKLWSLYYQTGNGSCSIFDGKIDFLQTGDFWTGCLAIFDFKWEM
ncbi:MAG: hypothetical protein IK015_02960 [Treponema sp.]|nr:hypothetical protein [Treponema sp.]